MSGPGRYGYGYPSRARNAAEAALARVEADARRDGMLLALLLVEREIYSCESAEEFYRWLRGAIDGAKVDE